MSTNVTNYLAKTRTFPRRVRFTGSTALVQGQGVCYDRDRGTAANRDGTRDNYVELPSNANNNRFAGVAVKDYAARTGGQTITIYEPGSVCPIAIGRDTVVDTTILTCSAGGGDNGRFTWGGFLGRGTALALQTNTSGMLESVLTGAAALDATGLILTDAAADFVTAAIVAGDKVAIFHGEADGTNTCTPAIYTVSSVTNLTTLVLTAVASDGGTMQCSYYVYRDNPTSLAYLYDGEESGLVECISPTSPGDDSTETVACMSGGVTYIGGGVTIATGNGVTALANGLYLGQKKGFYCLGTLTTKDQVVVPASTGYQRKITDVVVTTAGDADGTPMDIVSVGFDAAAEYLYLEWWGAWMEKHHSGCVISE